jgi:hypothetical protein
MSVQAGLIGALEEIKRNCEPWRKADNMAGRLFEIADQAIRMAADPTIGTPEAGYHPGSVADPRD